MLTSSNHLIPSSMVMNLHGDWRKISSATNEDVAHALVRKRMVMGAWPTLIQSCGIELFARKLMRQIGTTLENFENFRISAGVSPFYDEQRSGAFPSSDFIRDASNYLLLQQDVRSGLKEARKSERDLTKVQWSAAGIVTAGAAAAIRFPHVFQVSLSEQIALGFCGVIGAAVNIGLAHDEKNQSLKRLEGVTVRHIIHAWAQMAQEDESLKLSLKHIFYGNSFLGEMYSVKNLAIHDVKEATPRQIRHFIEASTENLPSLIKGFVIDVRPSGPHLAGTHMSISVIGTDVSDTPIIKKRRRKQEHVSKNDGGWVPVPI